MGFEGQIVSRWISMSVFDEFEGESHTKRLSCHVCPNWLYECLHPLAQRMGNTLGMHDKWGPYEPTRTKIMLHLIIYNSGRL